MLKFKRGKGLNTTIIIFLVIGVVFMVIMLSLVRWGEKPYLKCTLENMHECCPAIHDECEGNLFCKTNTCNTPQCQQLCIRNAGRTYSICSLVTINRGTDKEQSSCVSFECRDNPSKCSVLECNAAVYSYNPEEDKGINKGKDVWRVFDPYEEKCCVVNEETGEKTC